MTSDEKLKDIQEHPERHQHYDVSALSRCCMVNGVFDMSIQQAHAEFAPVGYNGGRKCDVMSGPCSCGAWH